MPNPVIELIPQLLNHPYRWIDGITNSFTQGKGGLRYCINSASLKFIPEEEMETAGIKNL